MLPARKFNSQNWLPDLFNDFFENSAIDRFRATAPAINVKETEKEYSLEVAAPGSTKEDFKIHVNKDGNLVIAMEKCKEDKEEKDGKYLRKEFSSCKFNQTLILPENADKDKIEACSENGILKIRVPKTEKTKEEEVTRMIEIK
ncbi:MAG: Hsp20/alpha crystallin family protein [Bacteroidales bacterium]|nr:Hsp20/alpha crystallin family protein [Bacteroidales bacterium]